MFSPTHSCTVRTIFSSYISVKLDCSTFSNVLKSFNCQIITTMNGLAKSYCLRFSVAVLPNENKAVFFSPSDVLFLKIMEIFHGFHFSVFLRKDDCEYSNDYGGRFLVCKAFFSTLKCHNLIPKFRSLTLLIK